MRNGRRDRRYHFSFECEDEIEGEIDHFKLIFALSPLPKFLGN